MSRLATSTVWRVLCLALLYGSAAEDRAQGQSLPDIKTFVHRPYIHGVPYAIASRYEAAVAVPTLLALLDDPAEEAARANIVTTLGMIGDQRAVQPLIAYIQKGDGKLSPAEYNGKTAAVMALGHLLNRQLDETALNFLTSGAFVNTWKSRLKWLSPYQVDRDRQLAQMAVAGLGLSGQPRAAQALQRLRVNRGDLVFGIGRQNGIADSPGDGGGPGVRGTPEPATAGITAIDEALQTNDAVRRGGLAKYYQPK
jgi:hypothetical protein